MSVPDAVNEYCLEVSIMTVETPRGVSSSTLPYGISNIKTLDYHYC